MALEHPVFNTDPRILCAARACKAWREAVQQCGVCNTQAVVDSSPAIAQLNIFSSWLHTHASLVRSIKLSGDPADESNIDQKQPTGRNFAAALLLLLQQALEAAALGTHVATPPTTRAASRAARGAARAARAAAAAAEVAAGRPSASCNNQRHCLRPASFSSDYLYGAALLAALPAHSLTHLDLHLAPSGSRPSSSATLSAALARLTGLQQLQLHSSVDARTGSYERLPLAGLA
jgi:hypothetical protein